MRCYRVRGEGEPVNERVRNGIHISINGMAAGLRNRG
jgi:phosphoenolpyruvate carboxylase